MRFHTRASAHVYGRPCVHPIDHHMEEKFMKKPVALRITAMIFIYIIAILYLVAVMFNPNLASIGGVAWFYLFLIVAIAVLAVSYTHLDVYKRQSL